MSDKKLNINEDVLNIIKSRVPDSSSPFSQVGEGDEYRFSSFALDFCNKLAKLKQLPVSGHCYFVYIPTMNVRDVEGTGKITKSFKKQSDFNLLNKVVLSLDSSLNSVLTVDQTFKSDDVWNDLSDEFTNISKLCGVELCHIIVNFSNLNASIYFSDSNEREYCVTLNRSKVLFSKSDLESFSDDYHENETKLPGGGIMIWDKQTAYKLLPLAEDRIVNRFALNISVILGKEFVSQQVQSIHGRSDILIHSPAMIDGHGPCVLEFKVLRHKDSDNKCLEWLYSGILQVIDYGKDKDAKAHYLMAYDGREKFGIIDKIKEESDSRGVIYKHYVMYNTADGQRNEAISNMKKNG